MSRPGTPDTRASFKVGYYGLAQVLNAALAMVLLGVLARALGSTGFGEFSFAFVVASVGALVADFGLGPWLTRAAARKPAASRLLLSRVLRIRIPLVAATWLIVLTSMWFYLGPGRLPVIALMLVYVTGLGYTMIYESLLMGRGEVRTVSSSLLIGKVLELSLVALTLMVRPESGATGAALAMATACLLRVIYVSGLASRLVDRTPPGETRAESWPITGIVTGALPFAAGLMIWTVYSKIDVLMLERFVPPDQLGLYTAAYRVIEALFLIPRSIIGVHFPIYADAWAQRRLDGGLTAGPLRLLLVGSAAAATVLMLAPDDVLGFLFGPAFAAGADTMRILGLALIPLFLNQFQAMYLGATDRQSQWLRRLGVALLINATLNLTLIPRYGIRGAAIATLGSELVLLIAFARGHWRELSERLEAWWVIRALAAVAVLAVVLNAIQASPAIRFLGAAMAFLLVGVLVRLIRPRDLEKFGRSLVSREPMAPALEAELRADEPRSATHELSVVVLTLNSERTLKACLESARMAGELLVIDSGSTDATRQVAESCGARVLERPMTDGWAAQRNFGHAAARGRWILALDSDEILDEEAAAAIARIASGPADIIGPAAWSFRVLNYFIGRPLRHGGLDRDDHVRLVRRDAGRWAGDVHERLVVTGPIGHLPGEVHHMTGVSLEQRLDKIGTYARMRARQWRAEGRRPSAFRTIWEPLRFLAGRLIIRGGWRDGLHGFVWWWLQATELLGAHFLMHAEVLLPDNSRPKILRTSSPADPPETHVRT